MLVSGKNNHFDGENVGKAGLTLNSNAVKHGLYRVKSRDAIKAQRLRRKVNRKLEGVPSELRPVMRGVTKAMVDIEDR